MNVTKYEGKKHCYLNQDTTPNKLKTKKYKLVGILENRCDFASAFISQTDDLIPVKSIND